MTSNFQQVSKTWANKAPTDINRYLKHFVDPKDMTQTTSVINQMIETLTPKKSTEREEREDTTRDASLLISMARARDDTPTVPDTPVIRQAVSNSATGTLTEFDINNLTKVQQMHKLNGTISDHLRNIF